MIVVKKVNLKRSAFSAHAFSNRVSHPNKFRISKEMSKMRSKGTAVVAILLSMLIVTTIPLTSYAVSASHSSVGAQSTTFSATMKIADLHLHLLFIRTYNNNIDPTSAMGFEINPGASQSVFSMRVDLHLHLFW